MLRMYIYCRDDKNADIHTYTHVSTLEGLNCVKMLASRELLNRNLSFILETCHRIMKVR
jgi:hypothetical protein